MPFVGAAQAEKRAVEQPEGELNKALKELGENLQAEISAEKGKRLRAEAEPGAEKGKRLPAESAANFCRARCVGRSLGSKGRV